MAQGLLGVSEHTGHFGAVLQYFWEHLKALGPFSGVWGDHLGLGAFYRFLFWGGRGDLHAPTCSNVEQLARRLDVLQHFAHHHALHLLQRVLLQGQPPLQLPIAPQPQTLAVDDGALLRLLLHLPSPPWDAALGGLPHPFGSPRDVLRVEHVEVVQAERGAGGAGAAHASSAQTWDGGGGEAQAQSSAKPVRGGKSYKEKHGARGALGGMLA